MSDDEWERWKAVYAQHARPIPSVLGRARTDRARARGGLVVLYLLSIAIAAPVLLDLRETRSAFEVARSLVGLGMLALLVVGARLAMRGTIGRPTGEPLALLAGLERRHAGRQRLVRIMPWLTGVLVTETVGFAVAEMVRARSFDLASALATAAACGLTIWLVRFTIKRTSRLIDRELREAAEARRLMSEE
jgi:hypothetical protein